MTTDKTTLSGSHNLHARFAPSAAHCWHHCTGAMAYIEANRHRVLKDDSSVFSQTGTEAHDWATKLLLNQITASDIPEDFRPYVTAYADHCLALVPDNTKPMVEVQVPLFYQPSKTGTCDFAVITDDRVIIRDLKYGAGILVPADGNEQLAVYALSLMAMMRDLYEFTKDTIIDMGIFQPRHREAHTATPWVVTFQELSQVGVALRKSFEIGQDAVNAVAAHPECGSRDFHHTEVADLAPTIKFNPMDGDQGSCRWCRARYFCCARHEAANTALINPELTGGRDLIAMMPDLTKEEKKLPVEDRIMARLGTLQPVSEDTLVAMYAAKSRLIGLLDDVEEYLTKRALAGQQAAGTKLVLGREGNRKWRNESEADTFLKGQGMKQDERYDYTLKSPAKVEALLKDKLATSKRTASRFETLISRSEAKKVLALESDKRQSVAADVSVMPNLEAEETFEP